MAPDPLSAPIEGVAELRRQAPLGGDETGGDDATIEARSEEGEVGCVEQAMQICGRRAVVGEPKQGVEVPEVRGVLVERRS